MTWDQTAAFLTDSRMWLVPIFVGSVFVAGVVLRKGSVSYAAWQRLGRVESFLVSMVAGVVYGPQWPGRIADSAGAGLSLSWSAVIAGTVMLLAFVAFAVAVRVLLKQPTMAWLGLAFVAYTVGVWGHVILRRGEPFASMLGAGA